MPTECSRGSFYFGAVKRREVASAFDGTEITEDADPLLLGPTDKPHWQHGRLFRYQLKLPRISSPENGKSCPIAALGPPARQRRDLTIS